MNLKNVTLFLLYSTASLSPNLSADFAKLLETLLLLCGIGFGQATLFLFCKGIDNLPHRVYSKIEQIVK